MDNTFQDINGFGASPDGLGYSSFGADTLVPVETTTQSPLRRTLIVAHSIASLAGTALGAYHGYKRNDSVGWAIGWALLGGLVPIVAIPIAFAQGLGKRKGR